MRNTATIVHIHHDDLDKGEHHHIILGAVGQRFSETAQTKAADCLVILNYTTSCVYGE